MRDGVCGGGGGRHLAAWLLLAEGSRMRTLSWDIDGGDDDDDNGSVL